MARAQGIGVNAQLRMGFGEAEFTPAPGLDLFGQMHRRIATRKRDPLMACAFAVASDAELPVVVVAADVCVLADDVVRSVQSAFEERTGVPARRLLIHATHTHVAPATMNFMAAQADPSFVRLLEDAVLEAAVAAVAKLAPVLIVGGEGTLEHMGWNRRAMLSNGSSAMYGHAGLPEFAGIEGPRDPVLSVLAARSRRGRIVGAVVGFSTHPNALEGESFYSADIPGEVRRRLKRLLGTRCVVYLTGAAGNTAPSILDTGQTEQPWRGEEGVVRSGLYVAGEAARVIAACVRPLDPAPVRFEQDAPRVPLRAWPKPDEPSYPAPLTGDIWPDARAYYQAMRAAWPRMMAEQSPTPVRLSVLRVGDVVFCTNPAELFVEHGLAMRAHSQARVTFVVQLTDGYVGYVPTRLAFSRGGYETWPAFSSRLAVEAGDIIVAATNRLISRCWS